MKTFPELFRKYRLKAEFETFTEFGNALSEKGYHYEESIFSRWQSGKRMPSTRTLILTILSLFVERDAIRTIHEANEFLSSTGLGHLTEQEKIDLHLKNLMQVPFQVPNQIEHFTGRADIIESLLKENNLYNKTILFSGPAGVGKTSIAIKLAHLIKDRYRDGILWYKVEEDNLKDILFSIAHTFGENLPPIKDIHTLATIVRSVLESKNLLIIFDSTELCDEINLLIPNSHFCTVIITSQHSQFRSPIPLKTFAVKPFTNNEVLVLFKDVLKEHYPKNNTTLLINSAKELGNLPLAVHIFARQLLYTNTSIKEIQNLNAEDSIIFEYLNYDNKNLYKVIDSSYKKLDLKLKSILLSAAIFKGKDFSIESISYINGFSLASTRKILQNLVNFSFIESSATNRFRMHPIMQEFVRNKLNYPRSSHLILIVSLIFVGFSIWWLFLQIFVDRQNIMYHIFGTTYWIIAFYGGFFGIQTSLNWGGLKTLLGRAIYMFSLGLFTQVFGQLIYSYYDVFKHIETPYPSVGDIGYFCTIPFYIYGIWLLAESSGIKINLYSFRKRIIAVVIPLGMLVIAYSLFLQGYVFDFKNPIKIFLDFGYPTGESIYISIAIITFIFSRSILDGIMQSKALLILIALLIQFLVDYIFVYQLNSYYPGNYIDFLCLTAYFVMTIALLHLKSLQIKVKI